MSTETEIIRARHSLRLETTLIIFKGLSHVLIGVFTPWAAALAQWANSDAWPSKIIWVGVILPASAIGGATQLQAFLSGSFSKFLEQREANK